MLQMYMSRMAIEPEGFVTALLDFTLYSFLRILGLKTCS